MKRNSLLKAVGLIMMASGLINLASACGNPLVAPVRDRIEFTTIQIGDGNYKGEIPKLLVIADNRSKFFPENWITSYDREKIAAVDLTKYLVIVPFFGWSAISDNLIIVTDIWQKEDIVYVRAQFVLTPGGADAAENSPYHIVQVGREELKQSGELTFELLDDYGHERASASVVLPAVNNAE